MKPTLSSDITTQNNQLLLTLFFPKFSKNIFYLANKILELTNFNFFDTTFMTTKFTKIFHNHGSPAKAAGQ